MSVNSLRHPKEKLYRTLCTIIGGLLWALALFGSAFTILGVLIPLAIVLWISDRFFRAALYGNAVRVSHEQYPQLNGVVQEVAQQLQLTQVPDTFVVNAGGVTNALAVKFLSAKYVLLFSSLVDLLWADDNTDRVRMVVAHELAHHAAGHMNFWVNLLMKPANLVPFLGSAYSRACELSADRIAASCIPQRREAAITAMICLASGSQMLTGQTSIAAFRAQEQQIPGGFGFVQEVLSSHPRMTKRIAAIEAFYDRQPHGAELASQAA